VQIVGFGDGPHGGARNIPSLYRYLDAQNHWAHFNNSFSVEWRDPAAVFGQKVRGTIRRASSTSRRNRMRFTGCYPSMIHLVKNP